MLRTLSAVLLLLSCVALKAQEARPELAALVGVYRGEALNGADLDPVTTTLRFARGRLTGEYVVEDESQTFHGTISNAFFEDGVLTMEWTDRDGEGFAEFRFSSDYRSFEGFWGSNDSPNENPWSGVRQ